MNMRFTYRLLFVLGLSASGLSAAFAQEEPAAEAEAVETTEPAKGEVIGAEPVPSRFGAQPTDEAYGAFQRGLYITARNLAIPRADAGDAAAQTLLAEIYSHGLGVPRDLVKAGELYEAAAQQGVPEAQFQYALMLLKRDPDNSAMKSEATLMMREAADAGNAQAQFNYAQLLIAARPGTVGQLAAFDYYQAAAEANIADAQFAVAQYYINGVAGVQRDLFKAREWLEKAASRNFDTAQLDLGNMMLSGVGGKRDLVGGFTWMKRAALGGNIAAQAALAKLYWGGIGVEADSTEAAAWYVLARREGFRDRVLDDFWEGISIDTQQAAIARANRLR